MNYEELYNKLSKKYNDEEIAEAYLIPEELGEEEQKQADEAFSVMRLQRLKEMTEEQRLLSDILRLRFLMEDYLTQSDYSEHYTFGRFLEDYIKILGKNKKEFASDIDIHATRLSRILKGREYPNTEIVYRLEKHTGNLISALHWWKLMMKEQEAAIKHNEVTRAAEAKRVRNYLKFRA